MSNNIKMFNIMKVEENLDNDEVCPDCLLYVNLTNKLNVHKVILNT